MESEDAIPEEILTNSDSMEQKRNSVLTRLADRHKSRAEQSLARKSGAESAPSFESADVFTSRFTEVKNVIESDLVRCRSIYVAEDGGIRLKSVLDNVAIAIGDMEKLVAENSYFLTSYDVRSSQKTIAELKEKLESLNSELIPRKKFSFRNKPTKKEQPKLENEATQSRNSETNGKDEASLQSSEIKNGNNAKAANLNEESTFTVRETPGFRNAESTVLVKDFGDSINEDFMISDLKNCKVYLKGCCRAIFVHRLHSCKIFAGPVTGSVLIEDAEDCLFVMASHQMRIHGAKRTDFYIRVRSRPIIEYCTNVRFAPYALIYNGIEDDLQRSRLIEETGNWKNVDDFRWLRAVQSPNWCLIPEQDQMGAVNFEDHLKCKE